RKSTEYIRNSINAPPMYTIRLSPTGATVQLADPFFPLPSQDQFPAIVKGVALAGQIFDRGMRMAYFHQYNASVQFALGRNLLFEAAYAVNSGFNLFRYLAINLARITSPQNP